MGKAIMMIVGLLLIISWGKYHLKPVGRHVKDDGIPSFIHILWLFSGLVLVASVYVILAVE